MRWPEFLEWTREERRAVLAVLLFTGGGGLILELGRRFPDWTPDLVLVSSLDRHRVVADSMRAGDSLSAPVAASTGDTIAIQAGLGGGAWAPVADPDPSAPSHRGEGHPVPPAGPIDINRADAVELTRLPGIGPKLAERIVLDRAAHGRYRTPAELDRVKGVGPALLQKLAGKAIAGSASDSASSRHP